MPRHDTGGWSSVPGPRESLLWAIAGAAVAIVILLIVTLT